MKTLILMTLLLINISCSHLGNNLVERQEVEDTVNSMFIALDNKDWQHLSDHFTETVKFDMSSLTGVPETKMRRMDIIADWIKGLTPVEKVHHQTGNFLTEVEGNEADVFAYGTATHYKSPTMKKTVTSFVGSYDVHLIKTKGGWKIDAFRFNKKYVD